MIYAYRDNNKWFGPVSLRSRFKGVGGWHTLTDEQRAVYDWYPCVTINENYNPLTQRRSPYPVKYTLKDGMVTAEYVLVDKSLSEIKAEKRQEINRIREEKFDDPNVTVEAHGTLWQADKRSLQTLNDAITLFTVHGNTPNGFVWRDYYNVNHPADLAFLVGIASAVSVHRKQIWFTSWTLKAQVDTAETAKEVINIIWEDLTE